MLIAEEHENFPVVTSYFKVVLLVSQSNNPDCVNEPVRLKLVPVALVNVSPASEVIPDIERFVPVALVKVSV